MFPSRLLSLLAFLALAGVAAAAPPTLTSIDVIDGANEDQNTTISYAALAAAADEADADNDPIEFRYESTIAGTLRKNGGVVPANGLLDTGESWVWTPPANANGVIDAFRVRAFAGGQESATDIVVRIDVTAVNDAPSFSGTNESVAEDSGAFSQTGWATGISAGCATQVPSWPALTSRSLSARTRASACSFAAGSPLIGICAAMPPMASAPRRWQTCTRRSA